MVKASCHLLLFNMPVAEPFSTRGLGNGLPFCIRKIDVSGYTYVAPMTLDQAVNLYYNLSGFNFTDGGFQGTYTDEVNPENSGNTDFTTAPSGHGEVTTENPFDDDFSEPKERVCGFGENIYWNVDGQFANAQARVLDSPIFKLYDGDIDDESNHLGYGYEMGFISFAVGLTSVACNAQLYGSFAETDNGDDLIQRPYFPITDFTMWWNWVLDMGTVVTESSLPDSCVEETLNGIPILRAEWTGYEGTGETWAVSPLPSEDGLEFYTYP
jgi:hypothetical protein